MTDLIDRMRALQADHEPDGWPAVQMRDITALVGMVDALRYAICPGMVTSRNDGDRHYVGPQQLMRLYQVDPDECVIYEPEPWWGPMMHQQAEARIAGLTRLAPRYDGRYRNPDAPPDDDSGSEWAMLHGDSQS